jgi:hypothetical protein
MAKQRSMTPEEIRDFLAWRRQALARYQALLKKFTRRKTHATAFDGVFLRDRDGAYLAATTAQYEDIQAMYHTLKALKDTDALAGQLVSAVTKRSTPTKPATPAKSDRQPAQRQETFQEWWDRGLRTYGQLRKKFRVVTTLTQAGWYNGEVMTDLDGNMLAPITKDEKEIQAMYHTVKALRDVREHAEELKKTRPAAKPKKVEYVDEMGPVMRRLNRVSDKFVQNGSDYSSGFADSLTFGATGLVRKGLGVDEYVDEDSLAYKAGEATEVAAELALTGGVVWLKVLLEKAIKLGGKKLAMKLLQEAGEELSEEAIAQAAKDVKRGKITASIRTQGKKYTDKFRSEVVQPDDVAVVHHEEPLFGNFTLEKDKHPVLYVLNESHILPLFPTGGLSPAVSNAHWNLRVLKGPSKEAVEELHRQRHLNNAKKELGALVVVNPATMITRGVADAKRSLEE